MSRDMSTDTSRVIAYYEAGAERPRLDDGVGRLEFARTQALLRRLLPPTPARILDVGGGPGRYSEQLAGLGYDGTLVDLVPLHVEQARVRASQHRFTAIVGDARSLPFEDAAFDVVLLFGPLYHLLWPDE